jgi:hypothetical protein
MVNLMLPFSLPPPPPPDATLNGQDQVSYSSPLAQTNVTQQNLCEVKLVKENLLTVHAYEKVELSGKTCSSVRDFRLYQLSKSWHD